MCYLASIDEHRRVAELAMAGCETCPTCSIGAFHYQPGPAPVKSALCVIVRDEARGLLEWIAYHRVIGFDEITVYDNQSSDGGAALCQRLADAGEIMYQYWPDPPPQSPIGPQVLAYEHFAATTAADWICYLDADEFLVLEQLDSVADLIGAAGSAGMPIALNWRIFGSSGRTEAGDGLVIDRFTRRAVASHPVNAHIKTLGPTSILQSAHVHVHGWVLEGVGQYYVDATGHTISVEGHTFVNPPCWRVAWVNHYIVKSLEEFELKRLRGKATHAASAPDKFDRSIEGYFRPYDRNEEEDTVIKRFRPALLAEIARLRR